MAHIAGCPVKDLALTVQHLQDTQDEADRQIVALPNEVEQSHERKVAETQLRHRYSALQELIAAKRPMALTTQATSPEGALHQLAIVSLNVENIWDFVPERDEGHVLEDYQTLQWGLYSVANLLESLCVIPRDRLGVETYMPERLSPFARTASRTASNPFTLPPATADERLAELNRWMEEVRSVRAAAWDREDGADGEEKKRAESIALHCENDIEAIIAEAATIVPRSLKGFALKARLLTCIYGDEDTNFTTGETALYRSLIGQLLATVDLGRIDDGSAGAREFLDRAKADLKAEAA